MSDIQTSTIRVPKNVLEDIKIYCRKAGQPVGEWVEKAWEFLQKNDFDIYDNEATPFLPIPAEVEKERSQVDALCKLMSEFIISQNRCSYLPLKSLPKLRKKRQKPKAKYRNRHRNCKGFEKKTRLCVNGTKRHTKNFAEYVTNKRQ